MIVPAKIVDAHHHLWNLTLNSYPWLAAKGPHPMFGDDYDILRTDYLIGDFFEDIADLPVRASVHLQADHDARDPVRESRWLADVAEDPAAKGFPQTIVGYADFFDPNVARVLEGHAQIQRVRGIRQTLHHRQGRPLENDTWLANFNLLSKYGFSFDLQVYPHQAGPALRLVDAHPDLQFILPHAGLPADRSTEGIALWRKTQSAFAERPNVVCKMSGFGMLNRSWQVNDIRPIVLDVLEIFGCERAFFGSNFPVDRFAGTYQRAWLAFFEITSSLSESERHAVFWQNAVRTYRIETAD